MLHALTAEGDYEKVGRLCWWRVGEFEKWKVLTKDAPARGVGPRRRQGAEGIGGATLQCGLLAWRCTICWPFSDPSNTSRRVGKDLTCAQPHVCIQL